MAIIEYKRLIIKNGSGKPTIPPSPSHDLGDWIATDIYENELYEDNDTKTLYTRVGDTIITIGKSNTLGPAIDFVDGVAANPPLQVDGYIYVIQNQTGAPITDVDRIEFQVGTTHGVRYYFNEFSMMTAGAVAVGDYLQASGSMNPKHNGTFQITAFDDGAGWIQINNPDVTSAGDDEATDSPAEAYFTKEAWDGAKINDVVEYQATTDTWIATTPTPGQTIVNVADGVQYIFNGTTWTAAAGIWTEDATNIMTAQQRHVLPLIDNAQNLGSDSQMWKDLYLLGKILAGTTLQYSTERTIPAIASNSNWSNLGDPYLGNWNAGLTPNFGEFVTWLGDVYQNISGANGPDNPVDDGGSNWQYYDSGYVGSWSSGGTYAASAYVDSGGFLYFHLTAIQEVFTQMYFDGSAFFFQTNVSNWMKLDGTKMTVNRIEPSAGVLNLFASNFLGLVATSTVQIGGTSSTSTVVAGASAGIYLQAGASNDQQFVMLGGVASYFRDDLNGFGIQYYADYSATFLNESLITKRYVDNAVGAYLPLSGGTMTGNELFSGGTGIDTTATGGTDALFIGATNADIINIGRVGATVNIIGAVVNEYATNAYVTDKLITLNSGGGAATGGGTGFEIEEAATITGYFKVNGSRNGFFLKTPAIGFVSNLSLQLLTADRAHLLPDVDGTLLSDGGSYYNPSWLTALAWAKITGVPVNLTSIGALADANGWLKNNGAGVFSYTTPTKSDVGLGNVDNTSDANKPVSTAQAAADAAVLASAQSYADTNKLAKSANLSDVANAATAFGNIKQAATTSATGVVELAENGETGSGVVVQGNDTRLGLMFNGRIDVSVASNNLTVSILTLAGATPSASDPVFIRLANGLRKITGALTLTMNAGTSWFAAGSTEMTGNEIDYFVYLGWNAANSTVVLATSRKIGFKQGEFDVTTNTKGNYLSRSYTTGAADNDHYALIGRHAATMTGTNWSVPTFDSANLVQHPIWTTRWMTWTPVHSGFSVDPTSVVARYKVMYEMCFMRYNTGANGTSNATTQSFTVPHVHITLATGGSSVGGGCLVVNNGSIIATPGNAAVSSGSSTCNVNRDYASLAYTASGGKRASNINGFYHI